MRTEASDRASITLGAEGRLSLMRRLQEASALSRTDGKRAIAAITIPVAPELDPSTLMLAARRPDDRFACFEQPESAPACRDRPHASP